MTFLFLFIVSWDPVTPSLRSFSMFLVAALFLSVNHCSYDMYTFRESFVVKESPKNKDRAKIVKGSGSDLCKEKVKGMNGVLGKEISGLLLFYLYLRLES